MCWSLQSFGQTNEEVVKSYLELNTKNYSMLNHGPVFINFTDEIKATVFFVSNLDTIKDELFIQGVLFNHQSDSYIEFGYFDFDPSFSKGVISVFFENVDYEAEDEIIFIEEKACRTYYADGGYAGIKAWYQTHIFDYDFNNSIIEYKLIGELLTLNAPIRMGTRKEEELIGRESGEDLNGIFGITNHAEARRKKISYFKSKGLLGG